MEPSADDEAKGPEGKKRASARRLGNRVATAARRLESSPRLLTAAKLARELLPGDSGFGDPLSTAGSEQPQVVGRRLSALTEKRPGVLREAGLSALQVWQSVSESQGRGRGERDVAIVFTDLVDFSTWALKAGDDAALELLRDVGSALETPVMDNGGEVVKRLGDGMMAVFGDPQAAFDALLEAQPRVAAVEATGYAPCFRAGIHVGRPRKIGGDYLGTDVNIAARLADQASGGEVLVSDRALEGLDTEQLAIRKRRRFKVKGVPRDFAAYSVKPTE